MPTILEVEPTAVELLDDMGLTLCRKTRQFAPLLNNFVEGTPNCILITEFYGENDAELRHKIDVSPITLLSAWSSKRISWSKEPKP